MDGDVLLMISVIIPLYNCKEYIKECIESLLRQDYKDFEIVVVDDGSTDDSIDIVKKINDPRIKIVHQENKGLFHARITGLKAAQSSNCMFLDADDLYRRDALACIAKYFDEEYDCIMYKVSSFYEDNVEIREEETAFFPDKTEFNKDARNQLLYYLFTTTKLNSIVCKAFNKNLIDINKVEKYPRIASGEDGLFTLELFQNCQSAIYLDVDLYLYRQRSGSISHNLDYCLYEDNSFRFEQYRGVARSLFSGKELQTIERSIDEVFFRLITSMALNHRFRINGKPEYILLFDRISDDSLFIKTYSENIHNQRNIYRIVAYLVKSKRSNILYAFKEILFNIRGVLKK